MKQSKYSMQIFLNLLQTCTHSSPLLIFCQMFQFCKYRVRDCWLYHTDFMSRWQRPHVTKIETPKNIIHNGKIRIDEVNNTIEPPPSYLIENISICLVIKSFIFIIRLISRIRLLGASYMVLLLFKKNKNFKHKYFTRSIKDVITLKSNFVIMLASCYNVLLKCHRCVSESSVCASSNQNTIKCLNLYWMLNIIPSSIYYAKKQLLLSSQRNEMWSQHNSNVLY